jgi:hypothetical protein
VIYLLPEIGTVTEKPMSAYIAPELKQMRRGIFIIVRLHGPALISFHIHGESPETNRWLPIMMVMAKQIRQYFVLPQENGLLIGAETDFTLFNSEQPKTNQLLEIMTETGKQIKLCSVRQTEYGICGTAGTVLQRYSSAWRRMCLWQPITMATDGRIRRFTEMETGLS